MEIVQLSPEIVQLSLGNEGEMTKFRLCEGMMKV